MSQTSLLIADIGATNARFAVASDGDLESVILPTTQFADSAQLIGAALSALSLTEPAASCLAIAGPVRDGVGQITNGELQFSETQLAAQLGSPVFLINDFHAQAMALPHLRQLLQIGGTADLPGTRVVLGPGSGLGVGVLVPDGERWRVLPSEGGHADIAAGGMLELEVLSLLHQRLDGVCWESVLSGPGLINLYNAVCAIWGSKPEALTAEMVSERGLDAADPVCHQTLEMFLGWLGAAAGNLALTFCARGGVFITGGIVPGWGDFVLDSPLRRRFNERAGLADYVKDIPLFVITEENPGLRGALAALEERLHG